MNYSIFYARLMGLYLVILSVGLVIKPSQLQQFLAAAQNPAAMVCFGIFALLLGLTVVLTHTVYRGWPLIITVLGYWVICKGIIILFFPDLAYKAFTFFQNTNPVYPTLIDLALGLILLVLGFMPRRHT